MTDRIGILILLWTAMAFFLRPLMLDTHHGAGGDMGEWLRLRLSQEDTARLSALAQWISFALPVAIAAMTHARFVHKAPARLTTRLTMMVVAGYVLLMTVGYMAFLWTPQSVFTTITHDSFIFIDSTYRVEQGQVPSRDFPTAIGAAAIYLPAFGAWLAGGYGGSVELASALVALVCGLSVGYIAAPRFPSVVAVLLAAVVILIALPATMLEHWGGESITVVDSYTEILVDDLTWAMFYNRWGWSAFIPLLLFLAPRRDAAEPKIAEIILFAALLAFLFYTKLTYFAVGVVVAGVWAVLNREVVRTLLIGAGSTAAIILGLGLIGGFLIPYIRDVIFTAGVSGGRTDFVLPVIRQNMQALLLACAPLAILLALGKATWRDGLVTATIFLGSMLVINQNAQLTNIVSFVALGAYGVARVWSIADAGRMARVAAMGVLLMLCAGTLLDRSMMLIDQAYAMRREEARPPAAWSFIPALKGVFIPERESFFGAAERAVSPDDRLRLIRHAGEMRRRQELRQGEYMQTLLAGIAELKPAVKPGDSVVTLDMTNPFPVLMGLRNAKGSWLTLHADRTISEAHHPAPEVFFADADHVMIAKDSMVQPTADLMLALYGDWLRAHYEESVESKHWYRFSRKKPAQS